MAIKIKPDQPVRRFVGVDVTNALDTIAWGHLWNATFGWRNLLWDLDKDPADNQRRVDKAHPTLPIARLVRSLDGNQFADTCIMSEGIDGSGSDKSWTTPSTDMAAGAAFMQTFLLAPGVNSSTSSLTDTGADVNADILYISSHGISSGEMFGANVTTIFLPSRVASLGLTFNGPLWVLLSNCNTLRPASHPDWLKLMSGVKPLRGIVGFQNTCPLEAGSVRIFAEFIRNLALKKTFVQSWKDTLTSMGMVDAWIVMCNENAVGDNISDWNDDKLTAIQPNSNIKFFDQNNLAGTVVSPSPDPFETFWSKNGVRITPANRSDPANELAVGDVVTITVRPPQSTSSPATFGNGTKITITLIYVRPDFPTAVDITKIFAVKGQTGAAAPKTSHQNTQSPNPAAADTWELNASGTPTEVTLTLQCNDLTGIELVHSLRLRVDIGTGPFDFIRNASIFRR